MASRLSFHAQLSSIMETMARSTLAQVCKLVDEDSTELQQELSRLLLANTALREKINSLECELTSVTSDVPRLCKISRSVGVQTLRHADEDAHESQPPTIEGVFGNDWCMNLWKDRDPYSVDRYTDSPLRPPAKNSTDLGQNSNSRKPTLVGKPPKRFENSFHINMQSATLSAHITVTEFKEEYFMEDVASACQLQTPQEHEEDEDAVAEQQEPLSADYFDGSTCSLSFDQDGEQLVSEGDLEEPSVQLVSINDTEETFSTHIIPIEEDEDDDEDDDVQFVQESQQETTANTGELSNDDQQILQTDIAGTCTALDGYSQIDFSILDEQSSTESNAQRFTCQICSRSFFHKGTLTRHMKSHRSTFCSICKQHFPRKSKLHSHRCVAPVPSQRVRKSCVLCGKIFANPSALRIHYVVHTGEKPHTCSLCGKGFTQKGNLKCHLRIHTGERPFHCGKCGRTFTQKVNLNQHLKAHSDGL